MRYKISRFEFSVSKPITFTYFLVTVLLALNTNYLRHLGVEVRIMLKVRISRCRFLHINRHIDALVDLVVLLHGGRLIIGCTIDILRGETWDVTSIA
jgi:hypothetical protein